MAVFGHRKCSGYISGHRKGFRAPLTKDMGLMGQEGKCTSHQGLVRPLHGPNQREKERGEEKGKGGFGLPLPFLPLLFPSLSGK